MRGTWRRQCDSLRLVFPVVDIALCALERPHQVAYALLGMRELELQQFARLCGLQRRTAQIAVYPRQLAFVDPPIAAVITAASDAARLDGAQQVAAMEADALCGFGKGQHGRSMAGSRLTLGYRASGLYSRRRASATRFRKYRLAKSQNCKSGAASHIILSNELPLPKGDAMSLTKRARIMVWATADGRLAQFTFDPLTSPYWVGSSQPGGIGGRMGTWFADKSPPGPAPTGVAVISGADSASLAGTVVTCNVPVLPAGQIYHVVLDALFA